MSTILAIPSSHPGGLEAELGAHFGHCDLYTLVTLDNQTIQAVEVIPNVPHQQGGCMAPVKYLAEQGAKALIAGGMGLRPLMGFNQVGIAVYYGGQSRRVDQAVNAFIKDELPEFRQEHTCGGSGSQPMLQG